MFIYGSRPAAGDGPIRGEQASVRANSSEAPLTAQVNQRKRRGRTKLREAAHLEFSDADGPVAGLLSERLNERAKWISRGIQNAVPAFWVVEAISPRPPEVQRGRGVQVGPKKAAAVRGDRKRSAVEVRWRLNVDACIPRDSKRKPYLQILASMHGDRDDLSLSRLGVDMMTSAYAPERPAVRFNEPAHFRPGDRFQTATSRICMFESGSRPCSFRTSNTPAIASRMLCSSSSTVSP